MKSNTKCTKCQEFLEEDVLARGKAEGRDVQDPIINRRCINEKCELFRLDQ